MENHRYTAEDAEPGKPVILHAECRCGQLVIAAGPTVTAAQRKSWRILRHHIGFANAAGRAAP